MKNPQNRIEHASGNQQSATSLSFSHCTMSKCERALRRNQKLFPLLRTYIYLWLNTFKYILKHLISSIISFFFFFTFSVCCFHTYLQFIIVSCQGHCHGFPRLLTNNSQTETFIIMTKSSEGFREIKMAIVMFSNSEE